MMEEQFNRRKRLIAAIRAKNNEDIGLSYLTTALVHAKNNNYHESAECIRLCLHFSSNDFLIRKYLSEKKVKLKISLLREENPDFSELEKFGEELFVKAYILTLMGEYLLAQELLEEYIRDNNAQSHIACDGDHIETEDGHDSFTLYIMGQIKEKHGSRYDALQLYKKALIKANGFGISKSRLHYCIGIVKCKHYEYPLVGDFYKSIKLSKFNIYSIIALKKYLSLRGAELFIDEELEDSKMVKFLKSFNEDTLFVFSKNISAILLEPENHKIFKLFRQFIKDLNDENSPFEDPIIDGEKSPTQREYNWNHYQFNELFEEQTYNDYNGTYAQDVMGFSDQDIRDAFGGETDAYWNIE